MRQSVLVPLVLGITVPVVGAAPDRTPESVPLSLEALFGAAAEDRPDPPEVTWRPGHETVVWVDRDNPAAPVLCEFDPETGVRTALLTTRELIALWGNRDGEMPALEDPLSWRPDGKTVLLRSPTDIVLVDLVAGELTNLETCDGSEQHPEFSPDGHRVAWVRDNDLRIFDLETGTETRLSTDGSATVHNGIFDWVYKEELSGRDGQAFVWSADGSAIAWLRLDDGAIPVHHVVDLMATHSSVTEIRYPKPGDPSPTPSLHVARFDASTRVVRSETITFDVPHPYVPRFGFAPDGDLWYQTIDRSQDNLALIRVRAATGERERLVDERDPYWVEPVNGLEFLGDGSVLWSSRRTGFMHLVRIFPDGAVRDLSPGPWDVTEIVGSAAVDRSAWYQAARPSPLDRRLYRVDLDSGETIELTPGSGSHSGTLSPGGFRLLVRSSSLEITASWSVVGDSPGSAIPVPVTDPRPRFELAEHQSVTITADDGIDLDGRLLFPPDFEPGGRYPVVVHTYGGPHAQVVRNRWPRTSGLFNHYLTTRGFVVFALDNRGSAARGREFEGAVDRALGSHQLPDQLAGVRWLTEQPWVDPDRIGIWGWSYGGYMTTYALTRAPGTFAAGAAVAPVTDWRLYDSVYTERYMGAPDENPEGYLAGSVLDAIGDLTDPLLVIHGTGDDNVHLQHSIQLADRAWRSGVRFDLMLFPNLAHGIREPGSHLQVFSAIADFFEQHLKP
jgi:dipeptidyl-peptidase-4